MAYAIGDKDIEGGGGFAKLLALTHTLSLCSSGPYQVIVCTRACPTYVAQFKVIRSLLGLPGSGSDAFVARQRNGIDIPGQRWDWQKHWYTFILGSVRVIFLSSEHSSDSAEVTQQTAWLNRTLQVISAIKGFPRSTTNQKISPTRLLFAAVADCHGSSLRPAVVRATLQQDADQLMNRRLVPWIMVVIHRPLHNSPPGDESQGPLRWVDIAGLPTVSMNPLCGSDVEGKLQITPGNSPLRLISVTLLQFNSERENGGFVSRISGKRRCHWALPQLRADLPHVQRDRE